MERLNSEQRIAIGLHPEVRQELEERQRQEQELFLPLEISMQQESIQGSIGAAVDGRDLQVLNEGKGWYREEKHGREVEVGEIAVQPAQTEGKYKMSAVIDGQVISHEISQRDYDKIPRGGRLPPHEALLEDFQRSGYEDTSGSEQGSRREDFRRPYSRCGGGF